MTKEQRRREENFQKMVDDFARNPFALPLVFMAHGMRFGVAFTEMALAASGYVPFSNRSR